MPIVQQFAYGPINPLLALAMALVGALFGLICTSRVRHSANHRRRTRWLLAAAIGLGGVGGWLTHFMAMLGFDVPASPVRYDLGQTGLSALIAIAGVAAALLLVGIDEPGRLRIATGGLLIGGAIAAMHYTGIAAIRINGWHTYDHRLVIVSILVAAIGSIIAIRLAISAKPSGPAIGAVVFAVTVLGTHYTAVAALRLHLSSRPGQPTGIEPDVLVVPMIILAMLALLGMLFTGLHFIADDELASVRVVPPVAHAETDAPQVEWELVPPAPAEENDPTLLSTYERAYSDPKPAQ